MAVVGWFRICCKGVGVSFIPSGFKFSPNDYEDDGCLLVGFKISLSIWMTNGRLFYSRRLQVSLQMIVKMVVYW